MAHRHGARQIRRIHRRIPEISGGVGDIGRIGREAAPFPRGGRGIPGMLASEVQSQSDERRLEDV